MQDRLQTPPGRWLTCACDDGQPPARDPAGLRPLHHHRVHDRRGGRPADHLAGHALLPARRSLHRPDHRARVPEEGERRARRTRRSRCSSPTPPAAAPRTRRRCSCRASPRWTTATSTRTASATGASRSRSSPPRSTQLPPKPLRRMFSWYFTRIYVHVRPERVYVWRDGDVAREPELFDAHLEEVRSGHDEEPADEHAPTRGRRAGLGRAAGRAGRALPAGRGLAGGAGRLPVLGAGADHGGPGGAPDPAGRRARWAFPGSPAWRA